MKYFTIEEMEKSSTAITRGVVNKMPQAVIPNFKELIEKVLDPIREKWGKPITVNSGYRTLILNTMIGGAANSQHLGNNYCAAADITVGSASENKKLFELIINLHKNNGLVFDQLIDEHGMRWIHISYKRIGLNRNQILKI